MTFTQILAAPVKAFVWTLDVCDAAGSPSLSKGIAAAVALVALRDAWLHGFSALNVSAMALAISAAFGRSVFMNWLGRWSLASTTSATAITNTTIDAAATVKAVGDLWKDDESGDPK